jgi:hypothetical protein
MIKKSFGIAVLLCICYALVLSRKPELSITQHQWQGNIIKAQKFLYRTDNNIENAIVGTSLAARINTDSLPGTFNLAFAGLSIYDGLHMLVNMRQPPKNIYVEMNFVLGNENEEFATVYSPAWLCYIKKEVPSLRDGKQPLGILGFFTASYIAAPLATKLLPTAKKVTGSTARASKNILFEKMLDLQKKEYATVPDTKKLDKQFKVLKDYIYKLEAKGAQIIFFEMPVDSSLPELPRARLYREGIYKNFPQNKYKYIPIPDSKYETGDGIHLPEKEALRYTIWLREQMKL